MSYWHKPLHYWHPQRQRDRWLSETLNKAPRMPHPLPGEIEEGWDIYRILEEIERLKPSIEAARKEWFERRRAEMPPEVKEWMAAKEVAAAKPQRTSASEPSTAPRQSTTLTPAEKRERKLQQTRESNARKRAERKAAGLPYK